MELSLILDELVFWFQLEDPAAAIKQVGVGFNRLKWPKTGLARQYTTDQKCLAAADREYGHDSTATRK